MRQRAAKLPRHPVNDPRRRQHAGGGNPVTADKTGRGDGDGGGAIGGTGVDAHIERARGAIMGGKAGKFGHQKGHRNRNIRVNDDRIDPA